MSILSIHRLLPLAIPLFLAAPAMAKDALKSSPLLGTWELDLTRMPVTYGKPPKRVTYEIKDVGNGQWSTEINIYAPDGGVRHSVVQYRPDGSEAPGQGDLIEADSAAVDVPTPSVMVMTLAKSKQLSSVRVYTVSADARELTEAAADVDDAGVPFVRQFYFRRIK